MSDRVHVHPSTLHMQWERNDLRVPDVKVKIAEYANTYRIPMEFDEFESVARTLVTACKKYHGDVTISNEFIRELARDRISSTMMYADNVNRRLIPVYNAYFYNCVPGDWREKLSEW